MKHMTIKKMLALECATGDRGVRFALNFARSQYGNRVGKAVAELVVGGHEVAVAQGSDGFFVDGAYVPVRYDVLLGWILGRN